MLRETPEQTARKLYPIAWRAVAETYGPFTEEYAQFVIEYEQADDDRAKAAVCARWLRECAEYASWLRNWGRA